MKNPLRTRTRLELLEAEHAGLTIQTENVRKALLKATEAAEAAAAGRRDLLISDPENAAALHGADDRVRAARERRNGFEDALRELQDRTAAAAEGIAFEQDQIRRKEVAAATDARAAAIEPLAKEAEAHFAAGMKVMDRLRDVLRDQGLYSDNPVTPVGGFEAIKAALKRQVAFDPGQQDWSVMFGQSPSPIGVLAAVTRYHLQPLRDAASRIRSGDLPPVPPDTPPAPIINVKPDETSIVLSESIEWNSENGRPAQANEGGCHIPVPVAEKAIALGIGFPMGSEMAAKIMRELQRGEVPDYMRRHLPPEKQSVVRRGPPWRNVGVNLYEWGETERLRLSKPANEIDE